MISLKNFKKTTSNDLDLEIERLLAVLKTTPTHSDPYAATADQLVKLYKLKEVDSKSRVSPDALLAAGASIGGILLVTYWEQTAHILTSKAFPLVGKKLTS